MGDTLTTENEPNEDTTDESPGGLRSALDKANSANKEMAERLETMERDSAFKDAGVPQEGAGKYFRKAYDGDMTSEAIHAQALADGIIMKPEDVPAAEPEPKVPDSELAEINRLNGAVEGDPVIPDDLESKMRASKSEEELMDLVGQAGLDAHQYQ
jgi:hypothetical protein